MANKKKQEEAKAGSPAWMATFSDLMNLLLCFFVLLFSMSSVEASKFELVIRSLNSTFSIMPKGGSTISEEGMMISSGISAMDEFNDVYLSEGNSNGEEMTEEPTDAPQNVEDAEQFSKEEVENQEALGEMNEEELKKEMESQGLAESEKMADQIEKQISNTEYKGQIEIDFTSQYVCLTLNGALLFASGQAELKEEAKPMVDRIGEILMEYQDNLIDVEGHTDNIPIHNDRFKDNNTLSTFRALAVSEYLFSSTELKPSNFKYSGRGEYDPVADNSTEEGRARNRRVEVKVYNSMYTY